MSAKRQMLLALGGLALLLWVDQGYGLPSFARKYRTSCATCHEAYPKVNPFGEAFRRNGYQFPGHTDAEFTKEDPVPLGAEGSKRAFPDAVWPGSMPGTSPLALLLNGEIDYNPKEEPRFSFGGLGNSLELAAAGTLGEDLSFWGGVALNADGEVELSRIFIILSNLIGSSYALNVRAGTIEPGVFSFSTHRAWLEGYWITTRAFSDDMGWTLEESQKAVEVNGMAAGRFAYSAGLAEGYGEPHSGKDYYLHATYKFGGLPLDGIARGGGTIGPTGPGEETSCTVGSFYYRGDAVIGTGSVVQGNRFTLFGGDVNLSYDRFNLFAGLSIRSDDAPFPGSPGYSADSHVWFAELDVMVFPWLYPTVRYESWSGQMLDAASTGLNDFLDSQVVPGIVALLRANVKFTLRAGFSKMQSLGATGFAADQVQVQMALGI